MLVAVAFSRRILALYMLKYLACLFESVKVFRVLRPRLVHRSKDRERAACPCGSLGSSVARASRLARTRSSLCTWREPTGSPRRRSSTRRPRRCATRPPHCTHAAPARAHPASTRAPSEHAGMPGGAQAMNEMMGGIMERPKHVVRGGTPHTRVRVRVRVRVSPALTLTVTRWAA